MYSAFLKQSPGAIALALFLFSAPLVAAPVAHFSRTSVFYGAVPLNTTSPVQPVFVTNTGDAALAIAALTLGGEKPGDFVVSGTCTPPVSLGPGERCRIDVVMSPLTAFPEVSNATLTVQSNATPPSTAIALTGDVDPIALANLLTSVPLWLDFAAQPVGTSSAPLPLAITLTSASTFPHRFDVFALVGGDQNDFTLTSDCPFNQSFRLPLTCTAMVTFNPQATGPRSTTLRISTQESVRASYWVNAYSITGFGVAAGPAQSVSVVEYYNAALDHYFITWIAAEQANLDAGNTPTRWTRTGSSFKAYTAAQPGTSPVCRFYIPPAKGDSHFFGRGTVECNATGTANPTFVLEDPQFMHLILPALGTCPAGTTPIYRVFSNRPDANHRYMTDASIRDQMVARGWLAEGDGPDRVVMCAP